MCLGGIQSGAAQQVQVSSSPTTNSDAIREPTVDEVRKEWQGHVANLQDQIKSMADQRVLRLREIAIDTAIRHQGGGGTGRAIIQAAEAYYAFLDTGAVPA